MNGDHSAVITNFRLASFLPDPEVSASIPVSECDPRSARWLAPELLFPEKFGLESARLTKETDIYAFAMVMYEVGLLSIYLIGIGPRLWMHDSCCATGFLWILPVRGSSGRSFNPAGKVRRSSMPARRWSGSRAHGRTVENDEGMLETQRPPLGDFAHCFDPQPPLCCDGRSFSISS